MLSHLRITRTTIKKVLCKATPAQLHIISLGYLSHKNTSKTIVLNDVRSASFVAKKGGVAGEKDDIDVGATISSSTEKPVHWGGREKAFETIIRSSPKSIEASFLKAVFAMENGGRWNDIESLLEDAASSGLLNDVNRSNIEEIIFKCPQFRRMGRMVQSLARYNLQPSENLVKTAARNLAQTKQLKELLVMVDTLREHKYHPSADVYHGMLLSCRHEGHWELALQIFNVMEGSLGRDMTLLAYEVVLETLTNANQKEAILEVINKMNKRCLRRHALEAQTRLDIGDVDGALATVRDAHRLNINAGENVYVALMKQLAAQGRGDELEQLVMSTIYQCRGDLKAWSRAARMWISIGDEARAQMIIVEMSRCGVDPWQMCYKSVLGLERVHLKHSKDELMTALDAMNTEGKLKTLPGLLSAIACLVEPKLFEKAVELFEANIAGAIAHTNIIIAADSSYARAFAIQRSGADHPVSGGGVAVMSNTGTEASNKGVSTKQSEEREFLWIKRKVGMSSNNNNSNGSSHAGSQNNKATSSSGASISGASSTATGAAPTATGAASSTAVMRYDLCDLSDPSLRDLWMRLLGEMLHLARKTGRDGNYGVCCRILGKHFSDRSISIGVYHEKLLQLITYRKKPDSLMHLIMEPSSFSSGGGGGGNAANVPWTPHYNLAMSGCLLTEDTECIPKLFQHMTMRTAAAAAAAAAGAAGNSNLHHTTASTSKTTTSTSTSSFTTRTPSHDYAPNVRTYKMLLEALELRNNEEEIVRLACETAIGVINSTHQAGSLHEDLDPEEDWRRKRANFIHIDLLDRAFKIVIHRILGIPYGQQLNEAELLALETNLTNGYHIFLAIEEVGFKFNRDDYDRMVRALVRGGSLLTKDTRGWLEKAVEAFTAMVSDHRPFSHVTAIATLDALIAHHMDDELISAWLAAPDTLVTQAANSVLIRRVAAVLHSHHRHQAVVDLFVRCASIRDTMSKDVLSDTKMWPLFITSVVQLEKQNSSSAKFPKAAAGAAAATLASKDEVEVAVEVDVDVQIPLKVLYDVLENASDLRLLVDLKVVNSILHSLFREDLVEPALVVLELVARDRSTLLKPKPILYEIKSSKNSNTSSRAEAKQSSSPSEGETPAAGGVITLDHEELKFKHMMEQLGTVLNEEQSLAVEPEQQSLVEEHEKHGLDVSQPEGASTLSLTQQQRYVQAMDLVLRSF